MNVKLNNTPYAVYSVSVVNNILTNIYMFYPRIEYQTLYTYYLNNIT